MPFNRREYMREYNREYHRRVKVERRAAWFAANGPCQQCGSWENLEVDHVDPTIKVSQNVWTWGEERRAAELAKCQVLCHGCHRTKTNDDIRAYWRRRVTECPQGHPYTPENTVWVGPNRTRRQCRTCHRLRAAAERNRENQ